MNKAAIFVSFWFLNFLWIHWSDSWISTLNFIHLPTFKSIVHFLFNFTYFLFFFFYPSLSLPFLPFLYSFPYAPYHDPPFPSITLTDTLVSPSSKLFFRISLHFPYISSIKEFPTKIISTSKYTLQKEIFCWIELTSQIVVTKHLCTTTYFMFLF